MNNPAYVRNEVNQEDFAKYFVKTFKEKLLLGGVSEDTFRMLDTLGKICTKISNRDNTEINLKDAEQIEDAFRGVVGNFYTFKFDEKLSKDETVYEKHALKIANTAKKDYSARIKNIIDDGEIQYANLDIIDLSSLLKLSMHVYNEDMKSAKKFLETLDTDVYDTIPEKSYEFITDFDVKAKSDILFVKSVKKKLKP